MTTKTPIQQMIDSVQARMAELSGDLHKLTPSGHAMLGICELILHELTQKLVTEKQFASSAFTAGEKHVQEQSNPHPGFDEYYNNNYNL